MAARDDSVIRGSLIACMIFLVLSLALNFFLWRWGDTQASSAQSARDQLANANSQVGTLETQGSLMKAMLGVGGLSQAEFDRMSETVGNDPDMAAIEAEFVKHMEIFGPEVDAENRNYPAIPEFLMNVIRSRNEQYDQARSEATKIRTDAEADVAIARQAEQTAKDQADQAQKRLVTIENQFADDRRVMNEEKEKTKDELTKNVRQFQDFRVTAAKKETVLQNKTMQLQGTIDTQKLELNRLRSDRFENTQGEIRYVWRGGNVVTINLGQADALRVGVTFGVIDGDETRLRDAKIKATIQVTSIDGPHLAQARVIARPEIRNPIIPGDMIYSPFWAPGRQVRIALAGDIDIDGDDRPDNEDIKGMIQAAGAVVAAEVSASGVVTGKLDASIRFLVVGEEAELTDDLDQGDAAAASIAQIGRIKAQATELGLTIIPAWKLQAYLQTIDDSLTTPLGSAARMNDFRRTPLPAGAQPRLPIDVAPLHKTDNSDLQKDNRILPP